MFVSASAFAAVVAAVASQAAAVAPDTDTNDVTDKPSEDGLTDHRRDYYRCARF
jgi:hypothetical protein